MQNIQISNPDVTAEDITKTAEELGVDNFTEYFSNGYYTEIDRQPTFFQFQKNDSLLRAFLGKTRLLILEDPFEGLNESLKIKIWEYLRKYQLEIL
jgi:ABC-type bacteriocin/lantibiotic exporter with double-glycine peptidase domain